MRSGKEVTPYRGKVRVVFKIERATVDPTAEHVYIMGSVSELGDWDVTCAKPTGYSGFNSWIVEAFFQPNATVDFKLCLMCHPSSDRLGSGDVAPTLLHREEGWFRRLSLTDVSLSVHVTYNHPDIVVTALQSRLTVDGSPRCLLQGNADSQRQEENAASEILTTTAKKITRAEHVSGNSELGEEGKKRRKKKKGSTLKKLLKKYGMEESLDGVKDGHEKHLVNEITSASEIKTMTAVKVNTTPCFLAQVVTGKDPLDEILVDTRSLRSRAHIEHAPIESGTKPGEHVSGTGEVQRENKKRLKKKKRGSTLKRLLKRYGMEETLDDMEDGKEKQHVDENSNEDIKQELSVSEASLNDADQGCTSQPEDEQISNKYIKNEVKDNICQQTTTDTGNTDWSRIITVAAPVGFGIGVAAASLYFWFKRK